MPAEVGCKIRLLREKHGLKQINLANALQVSPQAVSKWEKGASLPDTALLIKIARLFNVSTDYLLGITEAGTGIFEATVLCSGITHFAQQSISMNSREMADYVNGLFYHLTESVLKFDGIPVKYVGDGFLCFFSGPDHADRAMRAALHAKKVVRHRELVIALNAGSIYMGLVGHPKYAVRDIMGEAVNRTFLIAGWVSSHCVSGIGITESVVRLLTQSYAATRHDGVSIELLEEALDIYEIEIPP